jgi:hypothetical protein
VLHTTYETRIALYLKDFRRRYFWLAKPITKDAIKTPPCLAISADKD